MKAPSITFTQTQTSAEKQIVGESRDLEENGWLIASNQTSSSGANEWKKESFTGQYGDVFAASAKFLVYLEEDVSKYKKMWIIGESYTGELKFVDGKMKSIDERELKRVKEVVLLVNQHRKILLEERIKYVASGKKISTKMKENLLLIYLNNDDKGNYQEISVSKWIKKS